ncbi:MAG: threonylcarbamoyl-AMP synthase [Myxococcales bacterium]|nr:threonylcarbamoyl-AMP synthase [Myxococcales bacterium]
MIIEINPHTPEPRKVRRAVAALEAGEIIAYPTDTVYALGCDLANKKAIDRLYQVKGMNRKQPLAFICPDLADLSKYAVVDDHAYRLLRRVLPGPYTFVLTATREVPKMLHTSERRTVGIRVPDAPIILEVVRALGRPVISTTAHRPGDEHMVIDARDIEPTFRGVDLVLDGGVGGREPTTVVDLSHGFIDIVREGAGAVERLVQ